MVTKLTFLKELFTNYKLNTMKINMKKVLLSLFLTATITTVVVAEANAKPMFGTVTVSTEDWADGTCAYRQTCTVTYTFWIQTSSGCTTATIACI
jgi:hypothetical protein